eukprot:Skav202770  [mRNA]  locus=scaffold326:277001:285192:+ [translate_table: standard]
MSQARGRGSTAKPEYIKEPQHGDPPSPRFGHTTTFVGDNRVVLFGGATGDTGKYTITADAFMLNVGNNTWSRIEAEGTMPFARAAHAAACVDHSQMVIYGGATGGGSLSQGTRSDELYLLDIRNEEHTQWMSVPVMGTTPGRRYGHTMIFNKPLLIVFGGNNGQQAECDIWILDVERSPFQWQEVTVIGKRGPAPRIYHSAEVCRDGPAAGMMVVFGGRTAENKSLKDRRRVDELILPCQAFRLDSALLGSTTALGWQAGAEDAARTGTAEAAPPSTLDMVAPTYAGAEQRSGQGEHSIAETKKLATLN